MRTETIVERQLRLMLEAETRKMGDELARQCPPGAGFALFVFDFGEEGKPGSVAYVANGERAGVVKLIEEWLRRQKESQ